jgi:excisionase family DNA binding protein
VTPNGKSPVMTIGQCASYLQISVTTVYRMANAGKIPCWRLLSNWRFNVEDIDRWRMEQSKGNDNE